MKKNKLILAGAFLISMVLLGLSTPGKMKAQEASPENHTMGSFIQADSSLNGTESSTNETAKSKSAAAESLAPANLSSSDTSLPRHDVVDVSSYQSWMTQSDFNALKKDGVKTVVVKISEATSYTNPYAKQEIKYAESAGLNIAAYHFVDTSNASAEANYFATQASALGLSKNTVMIEDAENSGAGVGNWTNFSASFANTLKSKGYNNVRFYTALSWITTNNNSTMLNTNYLGASNMWCAQYLYGKPSSSDLRNTQYGAWQFTSQMYYVGVQQNPVDTSIDYDNIFIGGGQKYIKKVGNYYQGYAADGTELYGQQYIQGAWYLFNRSNGHMLYGQQKDINGQWYLFDRSSGKMQYGQKKDTNGQWYLFNRSTGVMMYGWQNDSGHTYYFFPSSGIMAHGWTSIGGKSYYFDSNSGVLG
jgi:glucan-binding YG repeat protein